MDKKLSHVVDRITLLKYLFIHSSLQAVAVVDGEEQEGPVRRKSS